MKVLTLWLGAFGFAMNKTLWENNPNKTFYGYEINKEIYSSIVETRKHPYFFEWYSLPQNIEVIDDYDDIIWDIDLLIIAIPAQFIWSTINQISPKLKPGVCILNLAKGIDISSNQTIFELINSNMNDKKFECAVLSWWMVAQEVVEQKPLWADLWVTDMSVWQDIKKLFESENLKIKLSPNIKNIELYGSLKNIMAIITWYYEAKWYGKSSIGMCLVDYYDEIKQIISLYWWTDKLDFSYYSLGGDIVATCFGNSRNRYLWNLLWQGNSISESLEILKKENKHAEWYETIKAVYQKIKNEPGFEITKKFYELMS